VVPKPSRLGFFSDQKLPNLGSCFLQVCGNHSSTRGLRTFSVTTSRLLKKSVAFGSETKVVAFVDIEMADETAGGAEGHPAAAADGIAFVVALPGGLRAG
jgi:hypothetical protein